MTDARRVWDAWRRILRDDRLVAHVLDSEVPVLADVDRETGAILAEYARTPEQSETNIGMYRRGLVRNALGALAQVPLSRHLLYMTDLDLDTVAEAFAQSVDYADYGPNFWQAAGAFVRYLASHPDFAAAPWQDVFALDLATVALAKRLAKDPPDHWPASETGRSGGASDTAWSLSRAAILVETAHDIAEWIEHPEGFDPDEPVAAEASHWLVYFPAAEMPRHYVRLSECAARVVRGCDRPMTIDALARSLSLDTDRVAGIVESLAAPGPIVPAPVPPAVQSRTLDLATVGA